MVHYNTKKRRNGGFTMVELMVVLAITAILAALVGGGLIAYIRMARFEKNEANARTLFQTAQIALTRMDTAGELDAFRQEVLDAGKIGDHFGDDLTVKNDDGSETVKHTRDELNRSIYALYFDKNGDDTGSNKVVRELLSKYIYDDSLLDAAICIEIDYESGQVYSVFYDTNSDKLRFNEAGATNIYDRSYSHRRSDSLVGYYSAEDRVNVVELQQTKLKVKNPRLSNNETLTLSWGGDETRDTNVKYIATAYAHDDAAQQNPLFTIEVKLPDVRTDKPVELRTLLYSYDENGRQVGEAAEKMLTYPLSYNKGNFVLTLDAMADADLLRECENDAGTDNVTKTDRLLYSITRLLPQGTEPMDFYMTLQAQPLDSYADSYTASETVRTDNEENTLFAQGSTAQDATLKYFRHIYNMRWAESEGWDLGDAEGGAEYKLVSQGLGSSGLNWTGGSVTVYTAPETDSPTAAAVAQVPSADDPVAWPTVPKLSDKIKLTGKDPLRNETAVPLINLQFRGSSVAAAGRGTGETAEKLKDRYIGLIGENDGTIEYITLRDVDLQVNVETVEGGTRSAEQPDDELWLTETTTVKALASEGADKDDEYRDVRAVGALCGVSTGTLKNCTLIHGQNNAYTAQVLAMLPFDADSVVTDRAAQKDTAQVKNRTYTYYKDEPRGIGGLVGVAMPKAGAEMSELTVGEDVTVAGLLLDKAPAAVTASTQYDAAAEQKRYSSAAAEPTGTAADTSVWRSIGVGGVFGTLDAANMTAADTGITNGADVTGSGFVGGIAGNLYSSGSTAAALTDLANTGTVTAGANYKGDTVGTHSLVLGQFFGGVAGYSKNVILTGCTSATGSALTESRLTAAVQAGYTADGSLTDSSPLKGDFVGGLVGFGNNITLKDCTTRKGYVLGSRFVGGLAGGFTGDALYAQGGSNSSAVFGNRYVGGIVSVNGHNSTVEDMTNSGLVAGLGKNAAYVGGIAGLNDAAWGGSAGSGDAASIKNCTNSMASDNATNTARITLLQNLSTYGKNQEAVYADYVGGLVGSNGKNAVLAWEGTRSSANTALSMGAVLYGKNFVGGIAGYNDATASITNTAKNNKGQAMTLTVTGQIVADGGSAVGGMIGLNCAETLPAVSVRATKIQGVHFVGGVIGANMPVYKNGFAVQGGTFETNTASGRVVADGLAGGIIGYNCLLQAAPTESDRTLWLPTIDADTGLCTVSSAVTRSDASITFANFVNSLNIEANAYVGGIVGYNDAGTHLTITNAANGSARNAASMGGLRMGLTDGTLYKGVRLSAHENTSYDFDTVDGNSVETRGYLAGGIIGYVAPNTTLENCSNYGTVGHTCAAGGLAGWNEGTIENCATYASLGSQQDAYQYLGGIAGVNGVNGKIINSAPEADVYVRGNYIIGGVAGINLSGAVIDFEKAESLVSSVQANYCAGGVAGVNCGTVTLGTDTVLGITVTANNRYAGGIVGSNNSRGGVTATVTGGLVRARITAGERYAGGAAGANFGTVSGVKVTGGTRVRATDTYAGGIAGINDVNGLIENCANTAEAASLNDYSVYAANGGAGGIAGINERGAVIRGVHVGGTIGGNVGVNIGTANGTVGGIAERNRGTIESSTVGKTTLVFTGETVGAAATYNDVDAVMRNVRLLPDAAVSFRGGATTVGGLAGRNNGSIVKDDGEEDEYTVAAGSLDLGGLTANADTITFGGVAGINEGVVDTAAHSAVIDGATVALSVTSDLQKYKNLGGVAGRNITASKTVDGNVLTADGTLLGCAYTGTLGDASTSTTGDITVGATVVGDTVGGIVGLNDGTVNGCIVHAIRLQVQGASGLSDSQTTAQKLENASHVGGIAGRNNGAVTSCYVADSGSKSSITARYGFVGGVAGSNNGSITDSGSASATALVARVNAWLSTEDANEGINAMVADMKNGGTNTYGALKGQDAVTNAAYGKVYQDEGLALNDLLVGLRGTTTEANKSGGYLGGIAGFNSVNGTIENAATGKWFIYGDNTTAESKVGGMIGMNEATGDLKTLVNCAAVRRFSKNGTTNDDDTTNTKNGAIAYVGGIIGVQQNTNDDQWTLSDCVNYGTVFDSGSNYIGGIIASWLKNGGTIEKCFNFGALSTNTNTGGESGTIGGIVGYFDQPTPGGTANILSCQNHGDILANGLINGQNVRGANDVAGILGKVIMANKDDFLRINIINCVNGKVTMRAQSSLAGIFGWLGPWDRTPQQVELNIDRCRNYSQDMLVNTSGLTHGTRIVAGISGNRGNGTYSAAATTITNCFTFYDASKTDRVAPIIVDRGKEQQGKAAPDEHIVAYGNYFVQKGVSYNSTNNQAMLLLYESAFVNKNQTKNADVSSQVKSGSNQYGDRLLLGIDNTILGSSDKPFYAAAMYNRMSTGNIDSRECYIKSFTDKETGKTVKHIVWDNSGKDDLRGVIAFWFKDLATGETKDSPDFSDITDEVIQEYYKTVLDEEIENAPLTVDKSTIKVTSSNDADSNAYGRYEVTWDAPVHTDPVTGQEQQRALYYTVSLYACDENGNIKTDDNGNYILLDTEFQNQVVYGTRLVFDGKKDWAATSDYFVVGITAVNGAQIAGGEACSGPVAIMRALPTPELEVRLKKQYTDGQPYGQYLVLKNAEEYTKQTGGTDWTVEAYLLNATGSVIKLTADNPEQPMTTGFGAATRLRATAKPGTDIAYMWMQSASYDEAIGIPKTYFKDNGNNNTEGNPGLVHGDAFNPFFWNPNYHKGEPQITGTTTDDLKITVKLSFTPNTIQNTVPKYRVMLLAKYSGDATAAGQSLDGQYITLAAAEGPVYSSESAFVLTPPLEAFEGSYSDFQVISVPVTAGYSQVVTRWDMTEAEAAAALQSSGTGSSAAAWAQGLEIVRNADGSYSYAHLTPLQFYAQNDPWGSNAAKTDFIRYQTRRDTDLLKNILPAPTVSADAVGEVDTANKLHYTFTWTQYKADGKTPDTTQHDYSVSLYGMLNDTDDTAKEKIELADGVSLTDAAHLTFDSATGTYTMTFCVDDELESGSTAWHYDRVSLHVTRVPAADSGDIGTADEAVCSVLQRLPVVSGMGNINYVDDNSAEALHYTLNWPNGQGSVGSYDLYAERLVTADDGTESWEKLDEDWPLIVGTSATVDLERYQGETLRFYVVSNRYAPVYDENGVLTPSYDESGNLLTPYYNDKGELVRPAAEAVGGFGSADGGRSAAQEISTRVAVPVVSDVTLRYPTPSQTQFLRQEQLQLTVTGGEADSYYYTGYLFRTYDDYKAVAAAAAAWQAADITPAEKAARLADLQSLLSEKLADGSALCLIDSDKAAGGEAVADGTTINVSEHFTMRPEYARYWLLPALRSMAPAGSDDVSSSWYYYMPGDYADNQDNAMRLPAITLDTPDIKANHVAFDHTVGQYENDSTDGEPGLTTTLELDRRTVEWPLVNAYTDPLTSETRSLTNTYQFTVTPLNGLPYTVTVTVNDKEYTDEDGTLHPMGEILKVEKTVQLDENTIKTTELAPTTDESTGRTGYDLSVLPSYVQNEDTQEWYWNDDWIPRKERITGSVRDEATSYYYAADVVPTLELVAKDTGEAVLRVTLPDLYKPTTTGNTLQKFTASVTVQAMPYVDSDGNVDEKTAASVVDAANSIGVVVLNDPADTQEADEPQTAVIAEEEPEAPAEAQQTQDAAEAPAEAAPDAPAAASVLPVPGIQTPETAAPAETEPPAENAADIPAA